MELQQLKTFQVAAASASFTRAAANLGYAQSSVSTHIQTLEKELGVRLFERAGRSLQLTEAGTILLGYAERILSLAEEAEAAVSSGGPVEGSLSIGAPETICTYRLPALLSHFRQDYPAVRLSFQPMVDKDIYIGVKNGQIDFGFLLQEPFEAEGLEILPLGKEMLHVLVAAGDPLALLPTAGPAQLEGATLLLTQNGCGYRHLFERELTRGGLHDTLKLEFNSVEAIKQCAMAGLGVAFLPQVAVADALAAGRLRILPWPKSFQVVTQLIYRKHKWLSRGMQAFVARCRQIG